jgi:hypothetical protein
MVMAVDGARAARAEEERDDAHVVDMKVDFVPTLVEAAVRTNAMTELCEQKYEDSLLDEKLVRRQKRMAPLTRCSVGAISGHHRV